MSQVIETRTPTGSPTKSPFKRISHRNSSPIIVKPTLLRKSPLKFSARCTSIDKETRRKYIFTGNANDESISILNRSDSLQTMNIININTNRSHSSTPVRSNSGSPLKNLINNLSEYERSSPLRRKTFPYSNSKDKSEESNDIVLPVDDIAFSFYEESQSDRERILEQYSTKNTMTATQGDQENLIPDNGPINIKKRISQNGDTDRTIFKELTSKEYRGSITDPKTDKTIYLYQKVNY